jgi:hypothetical protein
LAKKIVVKRPGFFYFHWQLHRTVPGQTGFASQRAGAGHRETLTKTNKTTSEEPDEV